MKKYQNMLLRIKPQYRVIACLFQIAILDILLYIPLLFLLDWINNATVSSYLYNLMGVITILFYWISSKLFFNDMSKEELKKSVLYAVLMEVFLLVISAVLSGIFMILYTWVGGMAWVIYLIVMILPDNIAIQVIAQLAALALPAIFLYFRRGKYPTVTIVR